MIIKQSKINIEINAWKWTGIEWKKLYTETFNERDWRFDVNDYELIFRGTLFNPRIIGPKIALYDVVKFYHENNPNKIK